MTFEGACYEYKDRADRYSTGDRISLIEIRMSNGKLVEAIQHKI